MKKILQLSILSMAFMVISTSTFAQRKLKEGVVKFELNTENMGDSPEMAMMGGTTLDFYFKGKKQKMDMNMMGGMMRIQTIIPLDNPKEGTILMDMMGQKIQVTEIEEEELAESNSFMNMDNVKEVEYDESNKKDIAGFPCYFAKITTKEDMVMKYYITEKIQPPMPVKKKDANVLKGYPLEMIIDTGQGVELVFTAKEVSREISDDVFKKGEGYTPMTMEEFQQNIGGLGGMGLGN